MDEHSLQSPFVFEVYQNALRRSTRKRVFDAKIEQLRRQLLNDTRTISLNRLGSGSSLSTQKSKRVKSIARAGITDRNQSEILVNLMEYFDSKKVLELGTSLGVNTLYLSQAQSNPEVASIEGNEEIAAIAQENFTKNTTKNIKLVASEIDDFFEANNEVFDMIYIDANHTYEATLRYFRASLKSISSQALIVLDDINWSPDMRRAWHALINEYPENLYIENDKLGIVFANRESEKNHYILSF